MINHDHLSHFAAKGLTINEGIAIDARLVQSASHPLKSEILEEEILKKQTLGKLDKYGMAIKFSRDLESD
jgi:IS5 family transposase